MMLQQIIETARSAGQIIVKAHSTAIHLKEGHFNFATDADLAVQNYLKPALLALLPGARFFAEEQVNESLTDAPTFVVDPIDGTVNYARGRQVSAVSIALLTNKKPLLAVIYNPYQDEMFFAEKGKGAYLNGRPIHVSDTPFENAVIDFGTSPYDAELAKKSMDYAYQFLVRGGDLRRCGSAALDLCDIACGRADIFFELRLRPWDIAAGSLIVQEAGGQFHSLGHEKPYYDDACGALASNAVCEKDAILILEEQK